jgi:tetratricopeptide (TPR) repeat protein
MGKLDLGLMRLPHRLLVLLTCAGLSACATTAPSPPSVAAASPAPAPVRLLRSEGDLGNRPVLRPDLAPAGLSDDGAFLASRAALGEGRNDAATALLAQAPGLAGDSRLRGQAFIAALLDGDVKTAAGLAPASADDDAELYSLGRLTQAVEALAEKQGRRAQTLLAGKAIAFPYRSAAALLTPWAAMAAGDKAGALVRPAEPGDDLVAVFGQVGHALLAERLGRQGEAEADYQTLIGIRGAGNLFVLDYGDFLERRGRWDDAVALYDLLLQRSPNDAAVVEAKRAAQSHHASTPMPTLGQGAASALTGPAVTALSGKREQTALAYLRLVLRLDPRRSDALVLVGDLLLRAGDVEGARSAYAKVPPSTTQYPAARGKLVWSYQTAGDTTRALSLARETVQASPDNNDGLITLADILHANGQDAEAIGVIDRLMAKAGPNPTWVLLYRRATVLDAAGRWPDAERDLRAALKLNPTEPQLQNFLAYSWIDRGENLAEAMTLVKQAASASPRSGAIQDSLGWAYYRTGDFKAAVTTLEAAVLLEPGDPEMNNHLGDAYWKVGRKDEAQFQWRRVLTLEPDARTRQDAEAKLKQGTVVGPTPASS